MHCTMIQLLSETVHKPHKLKPMPHKLKPMLHKLKLMPHKLKPKLHKLDNETSKDVEEFIASQQTAIQYTPPDMHRTNPAERAIQTWKSCKKSSLASVPQDFPIALWCRMCPQVDLSVNIIRKCRQNPLLSAWAAMEGEYHFNATPIAPPGTEMMMHQKPIRRKTFGLNAKKT